MVARSHFLKLWLLLFAYVHGVRAPRVETTACGWTQKVRRLSGYGDKFLPFPSDAREGTDQALCVGV